MSRVTIRLSEWTDMPSGRFRCSGPGSAEAFREDILIPALRANDKVTLDLETPCGFSISWLDEVLGPLVRSGHFSKDELFRKLDLSPNSGLLKSQILYFLGVDDGFS